MVRPALEVADILRGHGPAWREANRSHVSLEQLKVMSAIERCRTAALGGHVARCENTACGHTEISYNSCGNRYCTKCQGAASRRLLTDLFLGPDEGLGFVVVRVDVGIDVFLKLLEACEGGAAKRLPLQDRKPYLDLIEP